jgi:hypothetical protein
MIGNKWLLAIAAAGAVWLALRWRDQGAAWTVPGSEQDRMLREQGLAFDASYQNAFIVAPGTVSKSYA